ncbi:MAG: bile acid:sodium symporter family protein [Pseudomonadota bacterium]|nr:bile acid:sodium symporter family protein [Pseudomonadota bacterium]
MIERTTALFPVWAIALSAVAFLHPEWFVGLKSFIVYLLGMVMLGMGMTLTPRHFAGVLRRPGVIALGVVMQYGLMPLFAWAISRGLDLSAALLAGMVLVGASPGGTASNVICYLARGDLALSISLTAISTLLAVIATPLLTLVYAGQSVDVPVTAMLFDVFRFIIVPVSAGVLVNTVAGYRLGRVKQVFPLLSVAAIILIIAIIVALNRDRMDEVAAVAMFAVVSHNTVGLVFGYWLPRLLSMDEKISRTLSIEVGMQNSGLAVALAIKYFSASSALPGALFSIWHNLSGSALAAYWSRRTG